MVRILFLVLSFAFFLLSAIALKGIGWAHILPDVESAMFSFSDVALMFGISVFFFILAEFVFCNSNEEGEVAEKPER